MAQTGSSTGTASSAALVGLKKIRSWLRRSTADLSLCDEVCSDANSSGADWYITMGQSYLEDGLDAPEILAKVKSYDLAAGESTLYVDRGKAITEIRIRDPLTEGSETLVVAKQLPTLREAYAAPFSAITAGLPLYWAYTGEKDSEYPAKPEIVLLPPADIDYTVDVLGEFSSGELRVSSDTSVWTEKHPHLLVAAAKMFWADEVCEEKIYRRALDQVREGLDRIQIEQAAKDARGELWRLQE